LVYGANEAAEDDNPKNPRYIRITDMNSDGTLDPNTFRSLPLHLAENYLLKDGDILLARSGATVGKSFYYRTEFGISCFAGYLIRARVHKSKLASRFAYWFFQSDSYWKYVSGSQIKATIQNVNAEKYGDLYLSLPLTINEQTQIANFLDHETAKIDSLIEKQQQLIHLLKEKRQAVISHAVTKGLNPNVMMKDSGVEWLGQVPEHWGITKLKWKALTTSGSTPTTSKYELYYENGNIPWIRTTDLNNSDLYETPISITSKAVNDTACSILPINSILIAMYGGAGSIGKHALLKFESTINQAVCGVLPSKYFNSDYVHRFYEFYRPFWMIGAMGTRKDPNIGQDHIKEATVLLPPLEEQEKIAKYILDIQIAYDNLTNRAEAAIQLMQERRTALISAAVTGKIDVRNWQNPNNNNEAKMEFSA
jgi:type I restriction enzyme S subunit